MPERPGKWERLAQSASQGLQQGVQTGIHAKLNEMLEEKQYQKSMARQMELGKKMAKSVGHEELAEMFATNPAVAIKYLGNMPTKSGIDRSQAYGGPTGVPATNQPTQTYGNLPFGELQNQIPYEHREAVEEGEAPITQAPQTMAAPSVPDLQQRIDQIHQTGQQRMAMATTRQQEKDEEAEMHRQVNEAIQTHNAIQKGLDKQKELGFKERTLDLAERKVSRESEQKNVHNFISTSQKRASELPYQKNLLNVAKQSISEGKFGLLSPDNIAEMTGIEAFRTPGGEAFRTAIKEYFLQDIQSAGSRPNMFIEKMLANILPNVGKDSKANLAWAEMQRMKIDLDEKKQKLIEQLTPEHQDEYGYPKASLINDVNNKLLDYSNSLQDKTAYKLKEIQELDSQEEELQSLKKVPEGTPLTAKRAKVLYKMSGGDKNKVLAVAKKLGYKIIDRGLLNE